MISEQADYEQIIVDGESIDSLPADLYIPPDALRVLLDTFTGPLDLLLYLIRKQNIDILDIPIVKITEQYLLYIELLETHRFDLAAEYLLMAATLAEIKSRMLLPKQAMADEEDADPRMALVRQLQQYEKIKDAAHALSERPCLDKDFYIAHLTGKDLTDCVVYPEVALSQIVAAMKSVMSYEYQRASHLISRETLSVNDRMMMIEACLKQNKVMPFYGLYQRIEGREGLVVTMLAILALAKAEKVVIDQDNPYDPIFVRAVS